MSHQNHSRSPSSLFEDELLQEVAAVLRANPDAADTEVADAVNRWWQHLGHETRKLTVTEVCRVRSEIGVAPSARKPFQKRLFG